MRRVAALLLAGLVAPCARAADLKDPTRPPIVTVPNTHIVEHPQLPHVTAIFLSSARRVAIFNDQPVHAGDRVGVYRIDEVTDRGVRYSTSGHTGFAPLGSGTVAPH